METAITVPTAISRNAQQIIDRRYAIKNKLGEPTEDWKEIASRVVHHVAEAETDPMEKATFFNNAYDLIKNRIFLPNTPCLVNAGKPNAQLAGCYVLPVADSIKGIMKTATDAAVIHQSGGGTGFTFEHLRPEGSLVNTTHGVASGPISFMEIFDKVTDVIKQGGVRRGANMGIMRCDHPDILRFIHAKNNQTSLINFNVSVAVTDEFMLAVERKTWYQTMFNGTPWTEPVFDPTKDFQVMKEAASEEKRLAGMIYAPAVWNRIIESAHRWAEPGIIFIDTVNKTELMKSLGPIESCNPCGEQFLHSYNSCNLGSIDVSKFFVPNSIDGKWAVSAHFDWDNFREAVYWSVRFLDNVIDTCDWPLPEIDNIVKRTRPIGLGIMGFADLLLKMKIRYGSDESISFLSILMSNFRHDAWKASCELGVEKGAFPEHANNTVEYDSFFFELFGMTDFVPRNYEVTTVAPTGTISLVAECSSGIEPNFAWSFHRADTVGERDYVHPLAAEAVGIDLYSEVARQYSVDQLLLGVQSLPDYFVTAHEVTPEEHVRILAAAQKYVDNGVSKTVNGPENDIVENVDRLYRLAHKLGVKAVSYYRDGSRVGQVLTTKSKETKKLCGECKTELQSFDGCDTCVTCGGGSCTL